MVAMTTMVGKTVGTTVRRCARVTTTTTTTTTVAGGVSARPRAVVTSSTFVVARGRGARGRSVGRVAALGPGGGKSQSIDDLLAEGRSLYERGERMQGYKLFEKALSEDARGTSTETRAELLYCAMCCNAAFGDVETAKMYLREMQMFGLDFEYAMQDSGLMKMESSALMKNQLKKFAAGEGKSFGTVQREQYERDKAAAAPLPPTNVRGLADLEISSDTDESVEAIVKRVGALVALSIVGFVALFKGGMSIMEPGSLPFGF